MVALTLLYAAHMSAVQAELVPFRALRTDDFSHSDELLLPWSTSKGAGRERPASEAAAHLAEISKDLGGGGLVATCYAPQVFRRLRGLFGVEAESFLECTRPENLIKQLFIGDPAGWTATVTEGKSGSVFWQSPESNLLVKSVPRSELRTLLSMLPDYCQHMENERGSLLCKFVGCFTLRFLASLPGLGSDSHVDFVVMLNALPADLPMHSRFDLKGSTVGRTAHAEGAAPADVVRKDLDLPETGGVFCIPAAARRTLLLLVEADSLFLERHGVMDYSLLVGVHEISSHGWDEAPAGTVKSSCGTRLYCFGIIDVLSAFDMTRRLESFVKGLKHNKRELSCVNPEDYGSRFRNRIANLLTSRESAEHSEKAQRRRALSLCEDSEFVVLDTP
eukprot:CAMPEP_0114564336 /NCGR_PEP_ID=MMETSP0114-20121206/13659_1 /TAXON_ID=31324 /ORGANISM="Goniomonas sp, Strain m" /LENGTH=390 /DNA_ID=CAMNT_0001750383 /DNA_START=93 /DNA_END=1265 /DNA_ORIENTATION=+